MSTLLARADAARLPLADKSVDLVVTSPPYAMARDYNEDGKPMGAARKPLAWVDWMLDVVAEGCRVSRGLVLVNCAGQTKDWNYQPYCEGLLWEWFKRGGRAWRPAYWHRVGIPGSGGKQWLASRIEYVLAFTGVEGSIPWADNTANGHPPKFGPGGAMSNRTTSGHRVNFSSRRRSTGEREILDYVPPKLSNPGNMIDTGVAGGGHLGSEYAHENEAPFPEDLPAWFIRSHCPPGGVVLDPFSGSGTTVAAARKLGRKGIGFDLRMSQCLLGQRRLAEPVKLAKPAKSVVAPPSEPLLFAA